MPPLDLKPPIFTILCHGASPFLLEINSNYYALICKIRGKMEVKDPGWELG